MNIELVKANGDRPCRHQDCKALPQWISPNGQIIKGTSTVSITLRSPGGINTSYYCRDCIPSIYEEMKKVLNPALWVFM